MDQFEEQPPKQPPWPVATIDEIVATNLMNQRQSIIENGRPLSRAKLAERLSVITGEDWSEWRIIDLEGKRLKEKPPSPVKWSELVTLAIALDVTVFELVLPTGGDILVELGSIQIDSPPAADDNERAVRQHQYAKTARELSEILFRLPHEGLSRDQIRRYSKEVGYKPEEDQMAATRAALTELLTEINLQHEQSVSSIVTLDELRQDEKQHKGRHEGEHRELREDVQRRSKIALGDLIQRRSGTLDEASPKDHSPESDEDEELTLNREAGVLQSEYEGPTPQEVAEQRDQQNREVIREIVEEVLAQQKRIEEQDQKED